MIKRYDSESARTRFRTILFHPPGGLRRACDEIKMTRKNNRMDVIAHPEGPLVQQEPSSWRKRFGEFFVYAVDPERELQKIQEAGYLAKSDDPEDDRDVEEAYAENLRRDPSFDPTGLAAQEAYTEYLRWRR